jgi:magnesium transporter
MPIPPDSGSEVAASTVVPVSPIPYSVRYACWRHGRAEILDDAAEAAATPFQWALVTARPAVESTAFLRDTFGLHELEVEDALTEGERPHLHEAADHLFFTVPAIRMEGERVYFSEVAFHISKGRLVTVSTEPVAVLERAMARAAEREGPIMRDSARLAYLLIDEIVDSYYPVMDRLEDSGDALESDVFGGRVVPIKDLLRVKRRLLEVRRRLAPFRDILNGLLRHDISLIAKADRAYYQDVYDHVLRVLEHVDLNRDILASVLDANLSNVSNRLNQVMRAMTVIATILMSVTLVAGIYGMNFKYMPELEWPFGYALALTAMALIAGFELWLFRRKGWL